MLSNKKKLSVELNKAIEPLLNEYYGYIRIKKKDGYEVYLCDKDEGSEFYFGIIKETYDNNGQYIHYSCKPQSTTNKTSGSTSNKLPNFSIQFKSWLEIIKYYHQPSILDDPILTGYQEEFYNDFRIVDEDADSRPFSYSQQLCIVQFLDNIANNIDEVKDKRNEELIEEIKEDAESLKNILTNETKNGFMQKLSRLFAKARKAGLKTSNFIFKEFAKEFLKESAKWSFNFAINNLDKLPEYIKTITESLHQLPR